MRNLGSGDRVKRMTELMLAQLYIVNQYGADIRLPDLREEISQCDARRLHGALRRLNP
jgi:hypothetical protein